MNDIYHWIMKVFKIKHSTVLASKSLLGSRDLTLLFVFFSSRSRTCLANECDLVAHGWQRQPEIKLAISCTEVHQCESTDGSFGTHEKVAIFIAIVACRPTLAVPIFDQHTHTRRLLNFGNNRPHLILCILMQPNPWLYDNTSCCKSQ